MMLSELVIKLQVILKTGDRVVLSLNKDHNYTRAELFDVAKDKTLYIHGAEIA